ncbi:conserved exported hypothetical protein [uncultured Stenotrophomonas sp.]|uniref:Secreted protein n=1 Tax=uncultured Stenotrophomonas sp. TaxID=165438 RepID=A0A1Y5QAS1_9GAMM|nr:conserved exported hypothetical protein [uncultured Stenotrophomonas sp.]
MNMHNKKLMAFALLFISGSALAGPLQLQRPVPLAEDNDISQAVKQECALGEQLADFIREYAQEPVEFTEGEPDTSNGRVLKLEIVDAVSMGNAFMGHHKSTRVRGTLYQDGEKVASFKARRNSMGGAFAGFKGSCSVLGRTIKVVGQDIGQWLRAPADGVNLGD